MKGIIIYQITKLFSLISISSCLYAQNYPELSYFNMIKIFIKVDILI